MWTATSATTWPSGSAASSAWTGECDDPDGGVVDGEVLVLPGSKNGLTGTGSEVWTQDSPGVQGSSTEEAFGSSLAMGRLDDGPTDDLAIGASHDDLGGVASAGSVTVLLGSADGLTTAGLGGSLFHQKCFRYQRQQRGS